MNSETLSVIANPDGFKESEIYDLFKDSSKEEVLKFAAEVAGLFNYNYIAKKRKTAECYGQSSEMIPLFDEFVDEHPEAGSLQESIPVIEEVEQVVVKTKKKQKKKLCDDLENLPVEEIDIMPTDQEFLEHQNECREVAPTIFKTVEIIPKRLFVKKEICHTFVYTDENGEDHFFTGKPRNPKMIEGSYASPSLVSEIIYGKTVLSLPLYRQEADFGEDHFFTGKPRNPKMIEGSYASPSLVSEIIYGKTVLSLPLYRQEADFERCGLNLSSQTMSNWSIASTERYLEPLYDLMCNDFRHLSHLHLDETPIQVLENPKKGGNKLGTIIVGRSGRNESSQMAIYAFTERKDKAAFLDFLPFDYSGTVICDAADVHRVYKDATLSFCMAHARRKFVEYLKGRTDYRKFSNLNPNEQEAYLQEKKNGGLKAALQILQLFHILYRIERKASDLQESPDQIRQRRQAESKPVFEQLVALARKVEREVAPKSDLGKAVAYFLGHEKELAAYLDDGAIPIDNNACERMVKPFVMARKNFLFSNTNRGARSTAICFTLMESAILNGLDPRKYLVHVFEELSSKGMQDQILQDLLPYSGKLPEEIIMKEAKQ